METDRHEPLKGMRGVEVAAYRDRVSSDLALNWVETCFFGSKRLDEKGFMDIPKGYLRGVSVCIGMGLVLSYPPLSGWCEASAGGKVQGSVFASVSPAAVSAARTESGQTPEAQIRIVDAIDETRVTTLKGNTHPLARASFDKGPVSPDLPMGDLVLVLSRGPEMQAAFDQFVAGQYDKKSPNFHRWLTAEEVGKEFGPAQADIDVISNWLIGHGFAIQEVTKDRVSIRFSGTASQVEEAFHTEIHNLDVKGEKHIANMTDPQIPAALAPVVTGVKALHNFFPQPQHRLGGQVTLNRETGTWQRAGAPASLPTKRPGMTAPTGIRPDFGTANPYGDVVEDVAPYDFAAIYNVLPLWTAATPIDGTGQTIAIAGISNINLADVATFRSAFGLPAKAPSVVITNNDPGDCPEFNSTCADALIENTIDVEWAGAVAKGANVVLVISSAPTPTSDPLYLSANYIVQNKTAPIISVSFGQCEASLGNAANTEYNNLWESAASEGIAVFVASGDAGSPACDQDQDQIDGVPYAAQYGLAVNGIASTPYDTAVGGTDFNWGTTAAPYWNTSNASTGASALGYIPEVVWNQTCANPLALPGLQADAAYLGISGVVDGESACNFVLNNWTTINTDFQVNLAGLVDTVGGGGGESLCTFFNGEECISGYAKPAWQAGVPGIPNDGQRDIPDLSFFASDGFLGSAYLFCVTGGGNTCSYSATSEPTANEIGGTSVGTPAMAGVMALINQKSGSSQGDPNTVLYELAAKQTYSACSAETVTAKSSCVFNDIDSGTNAMPCESGVSLNCTALYSDDALGILSGYNAGTGYDDATGLGSLNVANVVNNWPGAAPFVILSTTGLTFASTVEGYSSATQAITLKNSGSLALSLNGTAQGISIAGTNASSFTQTNTCGTSVAAGASCTITVTFKPAAVGPLTAKVNIADNTYGSPQTVALTGTGLAPAPTVTLSANSISFSAQWVGESSTAPSMTLTNSGTAALSLTSISFTGTNASSFSQTNTCGTSVAVGATCNITITFAPKSAGSLTANLSVADNAPGSPQTVGVSGTGNAIVLSSKSLAFLASGTGVAAPTQQVTLTNDSNIALSVTGMSITGTNASSFSQTNTCGTSVAVGASCTVTVTFKPAVAGALSAAVNIADNAFGSPQTVTLSGSEQGLIPTVTVTPNPTSITSTQALSVKVTVSGGSGNPTPTGSVTLTSGSYTSAAATLSGGSATINIPAGKLAAGSDTLTVSYTPDSNSSSIYYGATGTANVSVTAGAQATLTTPAPGSTLAGSSVTFNWTAAANATGYALWAGTASSGSDADNLYYSGEKAPTVTSLTVSGLPTNGEMIYVRMITYQGSSSTYISYTYTAAAGAALTTPAPGSTLAGPSVTFSWTAGSGASGYALWIGSTGPGSDNLYYSGEKASTVTSLPVSGLPTNGETIYVRLITYYGSSSAFINYTYTAATAAVLTTPTPGGTLAGSNITFSWTAAPNATGYALWAGTASSGSDTDNLYYSGEKASTVTSLTVSGLPVNGEKIYIRLITYLATGSTFTTYTYTSATGGKLTTPAVSSTLTSSSVTFSWTAGASATGYALWIGSTGPGSDNLYYSGEKASTVTSLTVNGLPVNGETIYVRLITYYGSNSGFINYTYTAATGGVLTTPTPGSTLASSSVTFSWTAGAGANGYALWIGSTGPGSDNLYYSGEKASTVTSLAVSGLPTNGETIYVRLITYYGSNSGFINYTYTAH
jgi:subtilase family serine protease